MRFIIQIVAGLVGFALLAGLGLVIKAGLEVNDWIDRCADETSSS